MSKQKVSIHRALAELKLIDAKVTKQIEELTPTGLYQKESLINNYIPKEAFEAHAVSKFDSITALIKRKQAIKSAIVKANGETKVNVCNVEMTIAEAINYKQIIGLKRALIVKLASQMKTVLTDMEKKNTIVEQNLQRILEATFGKDGVANGKNDVDGVSVPYKAANEFKIFDPLDAQNKAQAMSAEIAEFESEIDAVLSEINATTSIEI